MLIEFRVKNYRSIRDEQVLSLVAAKDSTHKDTHLSPTGIRAIPHVVNSAVIYGANASGKSNLLRAFIVMRFHLMKSASGSQHGEPLRRDPFRLDGVSADEPTMFEATFIDNGVRYQYGFKLTAKRFVEEWLLAYPKSKPQQWFHRSYDAATDKDTYKFGPHLTGARNVWKEATRPNALFLSTAVQLNSELLRPIFNWFANKQLSVVGIVSDLLDPIHSTELCIRPDGNQRVQALLTAADTAIAEIRAVSVPRDGNEPNSSVGIDQVTTLDESERYKPQFYRRFADGSAVFEFSDESSGTQRLFCLSSWVLAALDSGLLLIVDELDRSLHDLLVRVLIDLFHSDRNRNGAQLIFTTHNTSLMDSEIFRRDQIWLVDKEADHATTLTPLTDFSPRKNEALQRGYLTGRYGGLPVLRKPAL